MTETGIYCQVVNHCRTIRLYKTVNYCDTVSCYKTVSYYETDANTTLFPYVYAWRLCYSRVFKPLKRRGLETSFTLNTLSFNVDEGKRRLFGNGNADTLICVLIGSYRSRRFLPRPVMLLRCDPFPALTVYSPCRACCLRWQLLCSSILHFLMPFTAAYMRRSRASIRAMCN